MGVYLRIPEMLGERTPYSVARDSGGRIGMTTLYRLVRQRGEVRYFDAELMEALCDVLGCKPGELLARGHRPPEPAPVKRPRRRPPGER